MLLPRLLILAGACAGGLMLPGAAQAAKFCVDVSPCTGGTAKAGLQVALTDAETNGTTDTVVVGAGTYTGNFSYSSAEQVTVTGAGEGETILQPGAASDRTFQLLGSTASTVEDMSFGVKDASGGRGIVVEGTARRVTVTHDGTETDLAGIRLRDGAVVEDATVNVEAGKGIERQGTSGSAIVRDSVVTSGGTGIAVVSAVGIQIQRTRIFAHAVGVSTSSSATIDDVVIRLGGTVSTNNALIALSGANVVAAHLTLHGLGGGRGIVADSSSAPTTVTVRSSSVSGFMTDVSRFGSAAHAANIALSYSRYVSTSSNGQTGSITNGAGNTTAAPKYVNAMFGDFRPAHDSPLVDAGDPQNVVATDLAGRTRPIDGDRDGTARPDMGALEYAGLAPTTPALAAPASVTAGESAAFQGSGSSDADADPLTYTWDFGDGATATGVAATHAFTSPGVRTVTLTVSDPTGRTATATAQVEVVAPPAPPAPPAGPGAGAGTTPPVVPPAQPPGSASQADRTAPRVTRLRLSGRTLSFRLSEAGRATVTVKRRSRGRWVRARTLRVTGRAGANRVRLPRTLRGRLRVSVAAVDAAGNRGRALTATLRRR